MLKRDDALKTVVKITTTKFIPADKEANPIQTCGTGFFVKQETNGKLYIITANHVTRDFNQSTIVEMVGPNNKPIALPLQMLRSNLPIIHHQTADVSAIEIDVNIFNGVGSNVIIFGSSLIQSPLIANLSRDAELTCIGFPNGLGTGTIFQPLSFRSFPSSNILPSFKGLSGGYVSDIFILEDPSCGGYSGCPVIDLGYLVNGGITQSKDTIIYGVMHGTISDNTGGKMAVVTPAYYILQII